MSDMLFRIRILVGTDQIGGYNNEFIRVVQDKQELVLGMYKNLILVLSQAIKSIDECLTTA